MIPLITKKHTIQSYLYTLPVYKDVEQTIPGATQVEGLIYKRIYEIYKI